MADVIPLFNKPESLVSVIRDIVKDSANVSFGPALDKGIAGEVAMSQVWRCLEEGALTNDPICNSYGDYLCELNIVSAGQNIYITVAVNMQDVLNKTITVLHISEG